MMLETLIDGLPVQLTHGSAAVDIRSVVDDSRQVEPGSIFVARPGTRTNGKTFITQAIERGAAAVLTNEQIELPNFVAMLVADDPQRVAIELADKLHGNPAHSLTLLAVTGTNGKSTTAWLMQQMLKSAGHKCGLISTTRIDDGNSSRPSNLTTPGVLEMRGMLGAMKANGCTYAVVEVSSHGIDQGRIDGLNFAAAVFTNLSGDHLDYHKTMDAYAGVKARLFERLDAKATAVVNADDPMSDRMVRDCKARIVRCSLASQFVNCSAHIMHRTISGTRVALSGPWGEFGSFTPLIGSHNIMNMLEAAAACESVGVTADALAEAIGKAQAPPGRLEPVTEPGDPFTVLVDYSHTDGALDTVLNELKPLVPANGKLRTLFGCGGDRDSTKRPRMARAALRYSDEVIITSDNPRTEQPAAIIDQILVGVAESQREFVIVEEDRAKAIELAIENCRPNDVLVIAGKGHETYQIIGATTRPFDDRVIARDAIKRRSARMATS